MPGTPASNGSAASAVSDTSVVSAVSAGSDTSVVSASSAQALLLKPASTANVSVV